MAHDSCYCDAPTEIIPLHRGFRANHTGGFSYPDQELRGICAHEVKRDGTFGRKKARMYLKDSKTIRYEQIINRKSHPDIFPRGDLSFMTADRLEEIMRPMALQAENFFEEIQGDGTAQANLCEESEYELLKRILRLLDGNLGKGNTMHVENLIENGHFTSKAVGNARLIKNLRDFGIIVPGKERGGYDRPGFYKLNL
jgi:hypothetical protein